MLCEILSSAAVNWVGNFSSIDLCPTHLQCVASSICTEQDTRRYIILQQWEWFGVCSLKIVAGINSCQLSWTNFERRAHLKRGRINHFTSVHVHTFLTPSVLTVLLGEKSSTSVLQMMTRPLQRKMWSGWPSRSWPEWPSCIGTAWCTWILK